MTPSQTQKVEKLARALELGGDLLSVSDVIELGNAHKVQVWDGDEALAVTQVLDYPRARLVDIFAVAGTLQGVLDLEPRVEAFAREAGAAALVAHGRPAWGRVVIPRGWQMHSLMFVRRLQKLNGHGA